MNQCLISSVPTPVAAYARMSTDRQDQSIAEQLDYIERYAARCGCAVVAVYRDAGRSGLSAAHRAGLQRLLADVARGDCGYAAVLVYDVSRWGRFQDIDESAYYEHLCRRHGVRVVYCAEPFDQEQAPLQHLFKDVKRLMAAEHSRMLSQRVFEAHAYLLTQGCKPGGAAGYGLRRCCLRADGSVRAELAPGENKAHPTDRVVLVAGPAHEVATVREIFRLYCDQRLGYRAIARQLNRRGLCAAAGRSWTDERVRAVLSNEKYCGNLLYNRISERLGGPRRRNPPQDWLRLDGAHAALVSPARFESAQGERQLRRDWDLAYLLDQLRAAYQQHGYLCRRLTDAEPALPHSETLKRLFGSVHQAYRAALGEEAAHMPRETRQARQARLMADLRRQVSDCIVRAGHHVAGEPRRPRLLLDGHLRISLAIRCCIRNGPAWGWLLPGRAADTDFVLCALCTAGEAQVAGYALLSPPVLETATVWLPSMRRPDPRVRFSGSLEALFGLPAS